MDYVGQRPEMQRELFLDTRLSETGLPFDNESLAQGNGETGLAGYYLQYDVRQSTPPRTLRPILDQADDIVAKTLDRHNRDARFTDPPYGAAAYYILDQPTLNMVAAITSSVVKKWTRTLWTKDHTLLLPDRRSYKYRGGQLTEAEAAREAHAKAVIIEVGAAVIEVGSLATGDLFSVSNLRIISEIVTGRGPEFLRQWMSKKILFTWLDSTGRLDEKESWDAFTVKGVLLHAIQSGIINPLETLERMKRSHDRLTTSAISSKTGWSADRVNKELPESTRKLIARRYTDIDEGLNKVAARLEEASISSICVYTGWDRKRAETVFTILQRRKIAVERSDPVREAVMAIANAHDFLEDTQALANFLDRPVAEVRAKFNPIIRRDLAKQARPYDRRKDRAQQQTPSAGTQELQDELHFIKASVREAAKRLDLLTSPDALAPLLGWTPKQTEQRILPATINYFATKGGDFSASLQKFCGDLASFNDARVAKALGISEHTAREHVSWSVRQRAAIGFENPLQALAEWWRGERKIGSSKRKTGLLK